MTNELSKRLMPPGKVKLREVGRRLLNLELEMLLQEMPHCEHKDGMGQGLELKQHQGTPSDFDYGTHRTALADIRTGCIRSTGT